MAIRIIIDKEFKNLIPPLRNEEYTNLEESLLSEGCREPITLWNDTIVDGHNRYEICTRLNIPFRIVHKGFSSRPEAVSSAAKPGPLPGPQAAVRRRTDRKDACP